MPGTPSTKYALPTMAGTDVANTIDEYTVALTGAVDSKLAPSDQGTLASRPPSTGGSPGKSGRSYWATDTRQLFRDNGTGWDEITPPRRRVADISGAATYTFSGLDGNVDRLYRLAYQGYWGGTADLLMSLILSDASATSSLHRRCYFQTGTTHEDVAQTNGTTGIIIAGRYFGGTNDVTGEVLIQAHQQPNKRAIRGSYTSSADAVANPAVLMGEVSGYWVGGSNMTALTLDFASSFDGRLSLETLS
jgi:hypothetical protein